MSRRLTEITNWPERAYEAEYSVKALADDCGVSVRTLERHIKLQFGKCPQEWLRGIQMQRAIELLPESSSIKETAFNLGYDHAHHFSRDFKKYTGCAPSQFLAVTITRA